MTKEAKFIDKLGGTRFLANKFKLKLSTVSNWKRQGIPHHIRWKLSLLAKKLEVKLPSGFWK